MNVLTIVKNKWASTNTEEILGGILNKKPIEQQEVFKLLNSNNDFSIKTIYITTEQWEMIVEDYYSSHTP